MTTRHALALTLTASSLLIGLALTAQAVGPSFPDVISLPVGWGPEGVATGRGTEFFAGARQGSPVAGAVYKGDLRTGTGQVLVSPQPGRFALGMKLDARSGLLFVAGGPSGAGFIYDGTTGQDVASLPFAAAPSFINDVTITRTAAFFTDSLNAALYRVPLGPGGRLPTPPTFEVVPLTGDFAQVPGFNANGIASTPDGNFLIVVQSATGLLFRVDPETGAAITIDLGGALVTSGDGLWLHGMTLYVCRNALNRIAVIELDPTLLAGAYLDDIISPDFSIPTTLAGFGDSLYAVNARFGSPIPGTDYWITRVAR